MNWLRINYRRLVFLLLPTLLRNVKFVAFLNCLTAPIRTLYTSYLIFRTETNYKLSHNSQICYLQAVLNDQFDFELRRIYITDAEIKEWSRFLWREKEDKPIMLGVFILNRESFIGVDAFDFVVHVPKAITLSNNDYLRMNAYLRYYKLASKRYIIEEYE